MARPGQIFPSFFVIFAVFSLGTDAILTSMPIKHSVGEPWPTPASITQTDDTQDLSEDSFTFGVTGNDCDLLRGAFNRYFKIIFNAVQSETLRFHPRRRLIAGEGLASLAVNVKNACEKYPTLESDESYVLSIKTGSGSLTANSIWGALRGLETFSQLVFQNDAGTYQLKNTEITDAPRFHHRGVLLDTSRHYLPVNSILANLEAMAYNKFNVFHWHIVDIQSFPYESRDYPQLSKMGAFDHNHIYTQLEVAEVIEFARQRGIRVLAEFDTPGHTTSWGQGLPGFLTACCDAAGKFNGNYGPIDPSNQDVYNVIKGLMTELTEVFPDHYLHLGGDEVSFNCWKSNPNITAFMKAQGLGVDYAALENYYEQKLLDIMNSLNAGYIVWQEVFDNKVKIRPDTVVHVWKGGFQKELNAVTAQGYKTIISSPWYLDYISYGSDWKNYYKVEPLNFNGTKEQQDLVMGGEACLWGEYVDVTNVEARLWPRASAVAERLWSPAAANDVNAAAPRMEEHRCRMVRRGINAEPTGPSFCRHEGIRLANPNWF